MAFSAAFIICSSSTTAFPESVVSTGSSWSRTPCAGFGPSTGREMWAAWVARGASPAPWAFAISLKLMGTTSRGL